MITKQIKRKRINVNVNSRIYDNLMAVYINRRIVNAKYNQIMMNIQIKSKLRVAL